MTTWRNFQNRDNFEFMNNSSSKDFAVAVHEAGHFVIAHTIGFACGDLDLDVSHVRPGAQGSFTYRVTRFDTSPEQRLQLEIAVLLAGASAMQMFQCSEPDGADADLALIQKLLCEHYGRKPTRDEVDFFMERSSGAVENLFKDRAKAVHALANKLLAARRLTASEAIEIITPHLPKQQ